LIGTLLPGAAATALVNIAGSLFIGFVAAVSEPGGRWPLGIVPRQFLMGGFCGGLTTFSAMTLESVAMLAGRHLLAGGGYLVAVVALSLAAVGAGHALATRLNRGGRAT
jgi:fluoride exporter